MCSRAKASPHTHTYDTYTSTQIHPMQYTAHIPIWGVQRQRGIPATFTGFEFSTDSERRKPPLHVYAGCKQTRISPYTSYTEGRTSLHFVESEAGQLGILGVFLKIIFFGLDASLFLVASYIPTLHTHPTLPRHRTHTLYTSSTHPLYTSHTHPTHIYNLL